VIAFDRIRKAFPGVVALDDVSLQVRPGLCHALLGENGAGKSTLGKILAGLFPPDSGRVLVDGREVRFASPRDAMRAGVGIVHQELVFCPNLSVAENLCLAALPRRGPWVDRRALRRRAREMLLLVGLDVDVDLPLGELSVAQEQMVQIAAAVGSGARVLVFDEPTSALGKEEASRLLALVRRLTADGATIIYISHRLEEILEVCQMVTVLRDGRHVATRPVASASTSELVRLMVGRDIAEAAHCAAPAAQAALRLEVRGLCLGGRFRGVNLRVHASEILGLAGLVGAGRTDLIETLYGLHPGYTGTVLLDGRPVQLRRPQTAHDLGIRLVPEDRKRQGLVLQHSVRRNVALSMLERLRRALGLADARAEARLAAHACRELAIRAPTIETPASALSGGNQQKVMLARALTEECRLLLIDEPTRGVDVAAKQEIHDRICKLARAGAAILLVSSDLPELMALADRVLVLRAGTPAAEFDARSTTQEQVLRAMTGVGAAGSTIG
jgi:ABC-type sugar transport system ATPase subunit